MEIGKLLPNPPNMNVDSSNFGNGGRAKAEPYSLTGGRLSLYDSEWEMKIIAPKANCRKALTGPKQNDRVSKTRAPQTTIRFHGMNGCLDSESDLRCSGRFGGSIMTVEQFISGVRELKLPMNGIISDDKVMRLLELFRGIVSTTECLTKEQQECFKRCNDYLSRVVDSGDADRKSEACRQIMDKLKHIRIGNPLILHFDDPKLYNRFVQNIYVDIPQSQRCKFASGSYEMYGVCFQRQPKDGDKGVKVLIWSNFEPLNLGTKLIPILRQLGRKQLKFCYSDGSIKASSLSVWEKVKSWLGADNTVKGLDAQVLNLAAKNRKLTKATDSSGIGQGGGEENLNAENVTKAKREQVGLSFRPGTDCFPIDNSVKRSKNMVNMSLTDNNIFQQPCAPQLDSRKKNCLPDRYALYAEKYNDFQKQLESIKCDRSCFANKLSIDAFKENGEQKIKCFSNLFKEIKGIYEKTDMEQCVNDCIKVCEQDLNDLTKKLDKRAIKEALSEIGYMETMSGYFLRALMPDQLGDQLGIKGPCADDMFAYINHKAKAVWPPLTGVSFDEGQKITEIADIYNLQQIIYFCRCFYQRIPGSEENKKELEKNLSTLKDVCSEKKSLISSRYVIASAFNTCLMHYLSPSKVSKDAVQDAIDAIKKKDKK